MKTTQYLMILAFATGCASPNKASIESKARERISSLDPETQNNINTLITMVEEQALISDPGEKRSVPYEFVIPVDPRKKRQVLRIDPSVRFTDRTHTYQCIGDNATKEKIFQMATLPYVYKLRFCPYE